MNNQPSLEEWKKNNYTLLWGDGVCSVIHRDDLYTGKVMSAQIPWNEFVNSFISQAKAQGAEEERERILNWANKHSKTVVITDKMTNFHGVDIHEFRNYLTPQKEEHE